MSMPLDVVLARHGKSWGNEALNAAKKGDFSLIESPEFRAMHPAHWPLVAEGINQARLAGSWIRENIAVRFDRYLVSSHVRALQTAGNLELPDASWFVEPLLREREHGHEDALTAAEREQFAESARIRGIAPFLWRPLNGESIADVTLRLRFLLDTLHRECDGKRVIIVCHGEVMEAFRVLLERLPEHEYADWSESEHPFDRIHNGQVIHYTRQNPLTGEILPYLGWRRSVSTSDLSLCDPEFKEILRPRFSNRQLLELAEQVGRRSSS